MPTGERRLSLVALLVVVAVLAGWSLWQVRRPSGVGTLNVVCSSIEDLCQEWASEFAAETGAQVTVIRMSSGQALARLGRDAGEFDVWHGGPSDAYVVAAGRGLLEPYVSTEASGIPADQKDADGAWTGVYRGMLGFCSNAAVLRRLGAPAPRSWDDLFDPRLEGQVSLPNPLSSGTGYTLVWTQRARLGSAEAALAWFRRLAPNVLQYTTSGMAPSGVVARGEAAVAITFTQHCVKEHDQGVRDLVVTYPDGVTGAEIGAVAIRRGTRQLDLARRYVDFAASRRAQELGTLTHSRQLPTRADAAVDARLELPRGTTLVAGLTDDAARARADLTHRFDAEIRP